MTQEGAARGPLLGGSRDVKTPAATKVVVTRTGVPCACGSGSPVTADSMLCFWPVPDLPQYVQLTPG